MFLKEGVCGDESYLYKDALVPLLRFESSLEKEGANGEGAGLTSLDAYIERMPPTQKEVYYLVAPGGRKQAESSPYLEAARARGYEVLFLYAHVDEFVMQHVRRHRGKDLVSAEAATFEAEETSEETKETQQRVNDLLIVARRRGVTPSALMFTSSTFRNPEFMETCARDGVSASDAFATGAKFAFDESPVEEEDFARALADEQKRVTEKYLAKRNGISFHSAGPQQPVVAPPPADEARQAAINSQIAKARVEARIALQKAGKLA